MSVCVGVCVCVCVCISNFEPAEFHRTWYEITLRTHPNAVLFNFLQSAMTAW
jgi:hypothetical protein